MSAHRPGRPHAAPGASVLLWGAGRRLALAATVAACLWAALAWAVL